MNISPNGENAFIVRCFKNRQALMNHGKDYKDHYQNFTENAHNMPNLTNKIKWTKSRF